MNILETHTVEPLESPVRLSDYVGGKFTRIPSRKGMKKAIKKGLVQINGAPADTSRFLHGGEQLTLLADETVQQKPIFELSLPVLLEDDHLALVNKPAGLLVSGNAFRTVENALPFNLQVSSAVDALPRPLPVHRLDFPTTGVLLVAKTRSALTALKQQFEARTVRKVYLAITTGEMTRQGRIDEPIDDKPAVSKYEVLQSVPSPRFEQLNLVRLHPITGRRHQLRKHLAHLGHPILGDADYGLEGQILKGKGLFLHAYQLTFEHPETGKKMTIKAELGKKYNRHFFKEEGKVKKE
ncbi:MAG: RluA family pseudouridine synthase [Bacteroidota bacterium]